MQDSNETDNTVDENSEKREGVWLKDAIHWGGWQYDEKRRVLDLFDEERSCLYYVRLTEMTKSEFIDRLAQLAEKSWITPVRLGNFLEAIDEIMNLRSLARMKADDEGGLRSIEQINELRAFERS